MTPDRYLSGQQEVQSPLSDQGSTRIRAQAQVREIEEQLGQRIINGLLAPGDRLPAERDLCKLFGASRKSVRAALTRLERRGLITRRLGSGTFVSHGAVELDPAPIFKTPVASPLDVLEVRRALEPSCMELVVARATEHDFERMALRLEEMRTARDQVEFKKAGYAFHQEMARASRNPIVISVQEMIIAARARAGWASLLLLENTEALWDDTLQRHIEIYDALRARDSERAAHASMTMLTEQIRTILEAPIGA
jgi:DNA-binding FadR family transcriptional regulator